MRKENKKTQCLRRYPEALCLKVEVLFEKVDKSLDMFAGQKILLYAHVVEDVDSGAQGDIVHGVFVIKIGVLSDFAGDEADAAALADGIE